ncbi:rod shape-determining protein MreD [Legionella feeleii]|uniref:Rod shape-determining protein MreD n=1 Tax=Legionella feeleii TaxID=453 RepID=A0A378IRW8_9GAMM|nr:Rod shape-determining protein MreD [Legionella feeleii]
MNSLNLRLIIAIMLALVLTILPLPDLLVGLRPPWVLMLVLYLQYYLPDHFNISLLVIIGLMLDVLLATVIGEHAFALCFVSWIASNKARRFSFFFHRATNGADRILLSALPITDFNDRCFLGISYWFSYVCRQCAY